MFDIRLTQGLLECVEQMLGSIGLPLMIDKRNLCLAKNGAFKIANCGGDGMESDVGGGDEISSLVEGKATSLATAPGDSAGRTIFSYPTLFAQFVAYGEDCGSR